MSKPRFTITLGRSGQVVKRGERLSEYVHPRADTKAMTGSKRFRDRIGSTSNGFLLTNKRQRGDGRNWSWGSNEVHGSRISPNDLRLKLMRKSLKQVHRAVGEHGKMDQHKTLSKTIQLSASHNMLQQRPTERSRFKDSRGFSTPIDFADPRQVPSAREASASRAGWLLSKDALSRPIGSTPFIAKGPSETSKPVTHLALMSNFGQKSYHAVEEPLTVAGLLQSLGLGKYHIHFCAEEVDMTALKQMGDKDLKEMGIPMGPRKKILALLHRSSNNHSCKR
ncbi:SEC23-interacting protein [Morella rubra]|uniref:SEC23-interacting protein n=1 Tax=Morella rubra TaxID=262757 RepID=A0A6A1WGU5_9ROSI|nr:SEC23-interacting protein [Morella rubra]KAB1223077.1 SEC23-interacting protein [Morella rubra]